MYELPPTICWKVGMQNTESVSGYVGPIHTSQTAADVMEASLIYGSRL